MEAGGTEMQVYCTECRQWYTKEDVDFINVEEDEWGRDQVTFQCKQCYSVEISIVRN